MKYVLPTRYTVFLVTLLILSPSAERSRGADDQYKPGDFPGPTESLYFYNETVMQLALGKEVNLNGRILRMRYSTVAPGGVIGQHSHSDRPIVEYILQGTATETKKSGDGKVVVKSVGKDEAELSTVEVTHWWKNESKEMVKIMAVDIGKGDVSSICRPPGSPRTEPLQPPVNADNIKIEYMGSHDLAVQFPGIPEAKDYVMRCRRLTILPKQKTKLGNGTDNPSVTYIIKGDVWENRSDEASSIRRTGEYSVATNGISYYWENPTIEPVILFVVDIVRKDRQ